MKQRLRIMRATALLVLAAALAAGAVWGLRRLRGADASSRPLDPAFVRLTPLEIETLPLAARFDLPMGSEHGALTYNAQAFRIRRHLGDDLNGIGGGDSDLGDPVYAAGAGRVVYAGSPGTGWGRMIILAHRLPDGDELGPVVQTIYAHLDSIRVRVGQKVDRGQEIGTVGTAGGSYLAHLHFEVRRGPYVNPGQGYADSPLNRVSPEQFIQTHQHASDIPINSMHEKP